MENLKLAKLYTLQSTNNNFIVFETNDDEKDFDSLHISDIVGLTSFIVRQFTPNNGDVESDVKKRAEEFKAHVNELINEDKDTIIIFSNTGKITYSGSNKQDINDMQQAINDFFSAYIPAYNVAFDSGYDSFTDEEMLSENLFTESELSNQENTFSQLGYNTGKRVGFTEGKEEYDLDYH